MKKILILTASFGDGHNAAARSLRDALVLKEQGTQVEVLDLFETAYGVRNRLMKAAYQGMVRYAPALWSAVFKVFDSPRLFRPQVHSMGKLRRTLATVLERIQPDVVVSTYPVYAYLIEQLFPDSRERRFRFITVVTDSISVCSAWYLAPSDRFIVANDATKNVLLEAGVLARRVRPLGFPVSPLFAEHRSDLLAAPIADVPPKVLFVINTGKALAGRALEQLLASNDLRLTITAGRNESLKRELGERLKSFGSRVQIYGWTNQMPELLMSHHLLIGKAGGAIVQETIAARCPMIINQVIPGQEEGNAQLIESMGAGVVARTPDAVPGLVTAAFANGAVKWQQWKRNLEKSSRSDAALRIADLVLSEAEAGRAVLCPLHERRYTSDTPATFRPPAMLPARTE